MSVIAIESMAKLLDELNTGYLRVLGTSGSAFGMGEPADTFGCADALDDITTAIQETADSEVQSYLLSSSLSLQARMTAKGICGTKFRPFIDRMTSHFRAQSSANYTNVETFLKYYNVTHATKWQILASEQWRDLYYAAYGVYPREYNVFQEILQGSTYTNAVAKFVVSGAGAGTTTDGVAIDSTKYCGGIPKINVSSLTGNGVVTVTGIFYDPATMAIESGKTALFTITAAGHFYRDTGSPGTAATDALLIDVTTITIAAGITAGTFYVEAERPALRSGTCGADVVTATTVGLDDSASSINDFYNGYEIATNADLYTKRTISDYDGATKVVTVSVAWATNPTASTSKFRVFRPVLPN